MSVVVERRGAVAWVILDDPERRNPLTVDFSEQVLSILDGLEADPACRVVVLFGRGKVFCSGADLGSVVHPDGLDAEFQYRLIRNFNRVVRRIRELDLPVICALNGPAVGGGAALALACDFAVASDRAALFFAFGRVGATSADMGCTWLLTKLVGPARARHLIMTGARVDAAKGLELGLWVDVVAGDRLQAAVDEIAEQIVAAAPRRTTAADKMALARAEDIDLRTALDYEAFVQSWMFHTDEHKERLAAFMARDK